MCGIAGFYTKDGKTPQVSAKQLKALLVATSTRGTDATGIFWETPKEDIILKLPIKAKNFKRHVPWDSVVNSHVALFHARMATQGDPTDNENNHPLSIGDWILIHNGIINNSDEFVALWRTDSMAILKAIDQADEKTQLETVRKGIEKLQGSMACALWNRKEQRLFLWRSDNPLCVGFKGNTIFFASTQTIIKAVKPDNYWIIPEKRIVSIKGNHMKTYVIKPKEQKFKTWNRNKVGNYGFHGEHNWGYGANRGSYYWDSKTGKWEPENAHASHARVWNTKEKQRKERKNHAKRKGIEKTVSPSVGKRRVSDVPQESKRKSERDSRDNLNFRFAGGIV